MTNIIARSGQSHVFARSIRAIIIIRWYCGALRYRSPDDGSQSQKRVSKARCFTSLTVARDEIIDTYVVIIFTDLFFSPSDAFINLWEDCFYTNYAIFSYNIAILSKLKNGKHKFFRHFLWIQI